MDNSGLTMLQLKAFMTCHTTEWYSIMNVLILVKMGITRNLQGQWADRSDFCSINVQPAHLLLKKKEWTGCQYL